MKEKLLFYYTNSKSVLLVFLSLLLANVALSQPMYVNTFTATGNGNSFPFSSTTSNKVQFLYLPGEFAYNGTTGAASAAPSGAINKIWVRPAGAVTGTTYNNVNIRMRQEPASLTIFGSGTFLTPTTTVYSATSISITTTANGWLGFSLQTPFVYDPSKTLIIEIEQQSYSGTGFTLNQTATTSPNNRRIWGLYGSAAGTAGTSYANMGIDVVSLGNNDIGVSSVDSPTTFCSNNQNIYATVKNYGKNQVTGFNVNWSINGVAQTPVSSTLSLDTLGGAGANTAQILVGNYTFPNNVYTTVKVWSSDPNSQNDTIRLNDTSAIVKTPAMPGGTYTIGGTPGPNNFSTIDSAILAMSSGGICGPVYFNIAPGVYTRTSAIILGDIAGASNINTITFDGGNKNTTRFTGSIASSAIFVLNNSKYVTVKNITFENFATTTPCAVALVGGTRKINLSNLIGRLNVNTSTSSTGYVFNITGSPLGAGLSGSGADSVVIDSVRAVGGGYSIVLYGSSSATTNRGIVLTNSLVDSSNYMGVYSLNNYNPLTIKNNTVNMQGWNYGYYGIYASGNQSSHPSISHEYSSNRINNFGGYGLYVVTPHVAASASTAAKVKIYNNVVISWTGTSSYPVYGGIYLSAAAASNIDVYHNTVVLRGINSTSSTSYGALYSSGSTVINVKNNIFAVYSGVYYPATFPTSPTANTVNYNNYYNATSPTANLVYRGSAYTAANYKTTTAGGDSSVNVNPSFVNLAATPYANLAMANGCDGLGLGLSADVPNDFVGTTRNIANPTLGAYEFTGNVTNNLAVQPLLSPLPPITAGAQDLKYTVKNIGSNSVSSYNAYYKLNSNTAVTQYMTNPIAPCMSDTVTFTGTNQVTLGAVNNLTWYTDSPNSSADGDATNDTLRTTLYAPLNGTYTVGGTTPDFATPAAAAAALSNGVAGPVVFDIRPGTYTGQVVVNGPISGSNATNTITFDGQNKTTTVINGGTSTAMFLINQVSYVTVRDITVTNTNASAGIAMVGVASNYIGSGTKIINCNVNVPIQTGTSTTGYGINFTATVGGVGTSAMGADSILVDSCTITGGGYGLIVYGTSNASYNRGIILRNNIINSSNYMGSYILNNYSPLVYNYNTINITSTTYGYYGVYMSSNQSSNSIISHEIVGNRINGFNGYGLYLLTPHVSASASTAAKVKIYNNIVVSSTGNPSYPVYGGVYISAAAASNIDFFHNTIVMQGSSGTSSITYAGLYNTGSSVILAKNNIFSVLSGNYYPASFGTSPGSNFVNYNIYYNANSPSAVLVYRNATGYTAANYRTATTGGDSSFNMVPPFNSSYILTNGCTRGVQNLDVPTDIIGYTRSTTPNVGAYEYQGTSLDLQVEAMPYPTLPISLGAQDLAVRVRNNGTTAVTSFNVSYSLNNGTPVSQLWSGTLATCDTVTVVFSGTNQISLGLGANSVKVFTSSPNFSADGNPVNDTLVTNLQAPLSGNYAIGAAPSDFSTFSAATSALALRGVSGPVVFNIKTGTYNEQVILPATLGASAVNTITFKSQANHVDSVVIANNTSNVVSFSNNANYYVLDKITINQTNLTTSSYTIFINNIANFDTIRNCKISAPLYDGSVVTAAHYTLYTAAYVGNGLAIMNNQFTGSYYGMRIYGSSRTLYHSNTVVSGNTFSNFYYTPFYYLYYGVGSKVMNNTFIPQVGGTTTNYMYNYYCDSGFVYTNNVWIGNTGKTVYLYHYYSNNSPSNPSIIANNRIYGNAAAYVVCGQAGTNNQDIVHNTFSLGSGYFQVALVTTMAPSFRVMNNVFTSTGASAYYFSAAPNAAYLSSDYNLVSSTGTSPYYNASTNISLPAMRLNYPGLEANSINYRAALTSTTNMTPNPADTAVWAINGRGTHLSYTLNDLNSVARPQTPAQGAPDLGAYEVTPTAIAPLATAVPATPVAGGTQAFLFGTDTVAKITYDPFANVPTAVGIRQYTGRRHPMAGTTQNYTNVYNEVTSTGPGSYYFNYTMFYTNPTIGTNPAELDLRMARYTTYWSTYTATGSTVDTTANSITVTGVGEFGDFIGTDNTTPLPVALTNFAAKAAGKNATISWTTASEKNASYFELYSSVDGKNFKALAKVKATGNSNTIRNYGYNHAGALANVNTVYYRLKSVDLDGSFTWSEIVSVNANQAKTTAVSVYPNPFNSNLTVSLTANAQAQVELVSLEGITVFTQAVNADQNGMVSLEGLNKLANGVYFVKITVNGETSVTKLIKQ